MSDLFPALDKNLHWKFHLEKIILLLFAKLFSMSSRTSLKKRRGCPTGVSMSMTCPTNPYTGLWAANGTRWDQLSEKYYEWPTDKYSVTEDSESVTVIIRHKPWPYKRLKVQYYDYNINKLAIHNFWKYLFFEKKIIKFEIAKKKKIRKLTKIIMYASKITKI